MARKLLVTIIMLSVLLTTFLPLLPAEAMDLGGAMAMTSAPDVGQDCPDMDSECCDDDLCASFCILHGFRPLSAGPNPPFFEDAPLAVVVPSPLVSLVRGPDVRPPIA